MHSPSLWLFVKEWRELLAARAFWILLIIIGPLVGNGFINAVNLYAEASGIGGGPAALSQGLTPLDGMLVPTLGGYELAVTLLFPFVAIRLIAAEKESGALKLVLQFPAGRVATVTAKTLALAAGWLVAWLPGLVALVLWKYYGGHLAWPELLNLVLGHWLRMLLATGIAAAAAAVSGNAASAAIITLSFTIGTWALDFIATGRGGLTATLAAYTPTAVLRGFEQGMLRLSSILIMLTLAGAGIALAAVWMHSGFTIRRRWLQTGAVLVLALGLMAGAAQVRTNWDVSENRRNSFAPAEEAALARMQAPLAVSINLAPEDPRLMDYERNILTKLRRILPHLSVAYMAQSRTGLFEGQEDAYGEIWYEYAERKVMNRSTTEPIVLEQLFELAGIQPPQPSAEPAYPGYPLKAEPVGAHWIFYGFWPLAVVVTWRVVRRNQN
ncbi:MAG: ABC transporter permease [Blastocatellia bacterium]|nr:ABC transporter permease [Blastocatellia bacterium]